jgi:hypothetical protein
VAADVRAEVAKHLLRLAVQLAAATEEVRDRCSDCPLSVVAAGHPEAYRLMETMLAEVLGVPVHQRCQMEPVLQCRFEVESPAPGGLP